jgi:hypothetical protein
VCNSVCDWRPPRRNPAQLPLSSGRAARRDRSRHSVAPPAAPPPSVCPRPCRPAPAGPRPAPPSRSRPRPDGLSAVYGRRDPTVTPRYPLVQHHLETFLADAATADPDGEAVAQWVEDDFRAHLRCGILAHGFARIRCEACAAERLVAFSCKGRSVFPSSDARRMVEVAAPLTYHVLPPLPLRQWVLSLLKRIDAFLPHDPRLAGEVLRIMLRGIRTTLRRASASATGDAQLGAVPSCTASAPPSTPTSTFMSSSSTASFPRATRGASRSGRPWAANARAGSA